MILCDSDEKLEAIPVGAICLIERLGKGKHLVEKTRHSQYPFYGTTIEHIDGIDYRMNDINWSFKHSDSRDVYLLEDDVTAENIRHRYPEMFV